MVELSKEQVFSALIDEKLPMLRRVVFRIVNDEHDTDDVIQTALLKAWNKFEAYAERSQLSSWVCRIASNLAYDLFRKRQIEMRKLEQIETLGKSQGDNAAAERLARTRSAIAKLPPKFHEVMNLTVFEEITPEEAASLLGCTVSTVYWRIHKARKLLKEQLANEANYE